MSTFQALTSTALVFVVGIILVSTTWQNKTKHYPPGPSPKMIIGNLFDLPTSDAAHEYARWGQIQEYESTFPSSIPLLILPSSLTGGILHASALGKHILVVNMRGGAEELFERRSAKYFGRPDIPIVTM